MPGGAIAPLSPGVASADAIQSGLPAAVVDAETSSQAQDVVDSKNDEGYTYLNKEGAQNGTGYIDEGRTGLLAGARRPAGVAAGLGTGSSGNVSETGVLPRGDTKRPSILSPETQSALDGNPEAKYSTGSIQGSDHAAFSSALYTGKRLNPNGWAVDDASVSDLQNANAKTFLTDGGHSGVAVKSDGDIIGVFSDRTQKGALPELMLTALENGGSKLDAYDGILSVLYARYGFVPVAKVPFSPEIAQKNGWNPAKNDTPKWVVAWVHNGDSPSKVATSIGTYPSWNIDDDSQVRVFDDYGEMLKYRDGLIEAPMLLQLILSKTRWVIRMTQ